jgi:hypothetical protein
MTAAPLGTGFHPLDRATAGSPLSSKRIEMTTNENNAGVRTAVARSVRRPAKSSRWKHRIALAGALLCVMTVQSTQATAIGEPDPYRFENLFAAVRSKPISGPGFAVVELDEAHSQRDLTGDGDMNEASLGVYTPARGLVDLGIPVDRVQAVSDPWILYTVSEAADGVDLNQDGDINDDSVLHAFNRATRTATNLKVDGQTRMSVFSDGRLVVNVREARQGNADRNGDGDTVDEVCAYVDLTAGSVENIGAAAFRGQVLGDFAYCGVQESQQGGVDLNGDGDANDEVMARFQISTQARIFIPLQIEQGAANSSYMLASESGRLPGSTQPGFLISVIDANGAITPLRTVGGQMMVQAGVTVMSRPETWLGVDVNRDGTLNSSGDVAFYDHATRIVQSTGILGDLSVGSPGNGRWILVRADEHAYHTDLTGDGVIAGFVIGIYDTQTGTIRLTSYGGNCSYAGDFATCTRTEQNDGDWNGDGVRSAEEFILIHLPTGAVTRLGGTIQTPSSAGTQMARNGFSLIAPIVGKYYPTQTQGFDLVGAGVLDHQSGTYTSFNVRGLQWFDDLRSDSPNVSNNFIMATLDERITQQDINHDGDATDYVLHVVARSSVLAGDTTAPMVVGSATPVPNGAGWHRSPVSISWTVDDPAATVPASVNWSVEGVRQTITSALSCDPVGNCASGSVSVSLDMTAPIVLGSITPAPNGYGWNRSPVTVTAECSDPLSGIATCSASLAHGSEGSASVPLVATDVAGNSTTSHIPVAIDSIPPVLALIGPAYGSSVPIGSYTPPTCEAHDNLSGVDGVCSVTISEPTAGTGTLSYTAYATATDKAGNKSETTTSYTVIIDIAAPTITAFADKNPNEVGWYKTAVSYSFTCTDPSGVASCPAPVTKASDGSNQSFSVTAADVYGNVNQLLVSGINIDTTPPVLSVSIPSTVNPVDTVTITCAASDALSGIASSVCTNDSFPAPNLGAGVNSFQFSATDRAGNTSTVSRTIVLNITVQSLTDLIQSYLGSGPGSQGIANSLTSKLAVRNIQAFVNQVESQCCAPARNKRFTRPQADTLIALANRL